MKIREEIYKDCYEEIRKVSVMRDLGASDMPIVTRNVNRLRCIRAWSAAGVTGSARDRRHHLYEGEGKDVATMVFDKYSMQDGLDECAWGR